VSFSLDRSLYAGLYGPGEGDLIRLGDTSLWARVERSAVPVGEEGLIGAGRNIRDGMLARASTSRESALDVCIKSAVILDPVLGVLKGDIGIKDGRIVGLGHAGNPDVQDQVDMPLDTNTGILPAAGLIATPGAIDCHVHLITAALADVYLGLGYTTLIGGSAGLMFDVGTNPRWVLDRMMDSLSGLPINMAFVGRAASTASPLEEMLSWGVSGFKIHEDLGAYPSVIDKTLTVSDEYDVQTLIHTDTMNESVSLGETIAAIDGRTIHAYHVEGAGGGHAPDLLEIVSEPNVLTSSTNPTNPFTLGATKEHLDMIMAVHLLNPNVPEDIAFAQARVRPETMAAEDLLHDMGAISMMGSDSLGMGHAGESVRRTWQLAHVMRERDPTDREDDNERILRYLAKHTINPAIAHGLADHVGSLEPGKLADIVLWRPGWFGVKPEMVIKDGLISYASCGHGNGSTAQVEPTRLRPMFGSIGQAPTRLGHFFVAGSALDNSKVPPQHSARMLGVSQTRRLSSSDMVRNDALPEVKVDSDSFQVRIDDQPVEVTPATEVPLSRRYLLS
jgi:urease subunit alpha